MKNLWKFLVPAAIFGVYVTQKKIKPSSKKPDGLFHYHSPVFVGEDILVDVGFLESLNLVEEFAKKYNLKIYVTSSFRKADNPVDGVVEQSQTSNHFVGHAIDMNPEFEGNLYKSTDMQDFDELPGPVQNFLYDISESSQLRWGGNFQPKDTVHIDDNLYHKNKQRWLDLYNKYQKSTLIDL